jgi:hypothetical protein
MLLGGVLALLAVVAVASASHAPGTGTSRPAAPAPALLRDYIATLAILIVPLGALIFVWAAILKKTYRHVPLQSKEIPMHVAPQPIVWFAAFLIAAAVALHFQKPPNTGRGGAAAPPAVSAKGKDDSTNKKYEPQFQWLPMLVVGSLVFGFGSAMVVIALRRRRGLLPEIPVRERIEMVLDETLDDLHNEKDPRKAVIRAYAKMERIFAAVGVPRRESEAPDEYLGRVLDLVTVGSVSAKRLTRLFARARFSPHEIDAGMRQEAIDAVSGLRAELAAP